MKAIKKVYLGWWIGWLYFTAMATLDVIILEGMKIEEIILSHEIAQQCIVLGLSMSTYITLQLICLAFIAYVAYGMWRLLKNRK